MEEKEIWKAIEDYEGVYEVSNLGRVRSLDRTMYNRKTFIKGRVLKLWLNNQGYTMIVFKSLGRAKRFLVHRLVAKAFIPNPDNKPHVNHLNVITDDNRVENLEWCTPSENALHGFKMGTKINTLIPKKGEDCFKAKLKEKEVKEIRRKFKTGNFSQTELAINYNVDQTTIGYIIKYQTWKHI